MGGLQSSQAPPPPFFTLDPVLDPTTPDYKEGKLSHPPQYGFEENGKRRKERVMIATQADLESAMVPPKFRDYCAHKYIEFQKCKKDEFPFLYKCHHERHDYMNCQNEDYKIRMKEYERERRLLHRKQRKEARLAKEAAIASDD